MEKGSCLQRMIGNIKTGVILKDVSMSVHSGEVLAVLGSKGTKIEYPGPTTCIILDVTLLIQFYILGSGKKALLDVISRRAQGPIRGQILLNSHPLSLCLFQQRCAYVTHKCDFISGLTVQQTLYYTPTKVREIFLFYYVKLK